MRQLIARELRKAQRKIQPENVALAICTSGTAAALSEAVAAWGRAADASGKPGAKGGGQIPEAVADKGPRQANLQALTVRQSARSGGRPELLPPREVRKLADRLAQMTLAERVAVEGIGPRRAEIIVPGAMVFAELLESFGLPGFRYSPLGLRDGILAQMLAEQDARATVTGVRARALGERAGHGAALRGRSAPG
jgi:exopolyphosphatase/guanosine-5'-triphosphate,3'-diphosphate pyrophosphatase